MKKLFLGANWKMNEPPVGSCADDSPFRSTETVDIFVYPSFIDLHTLRNHQFFTGAQWGHHLESGAWTGDVSMKMLSDQRIISVLCGHSERRAHYAETDETVAKQFRSALDFDIIPVLCVGETAEERAQGKTEEVLKRQVLTAVTERPKRHGEFLIAYEPVWAISGGNPNKPAASISDAENGHRFIRSILPKELQSVRIIYGGSMKASNAADLLAQPNIDGGLIGGASLKPEEFAGIVEAAKKLKMEN